MVWAGQSRTDSPVLHGANWTVHRQFCLPWCEPDNARTDSPKFDCARGQGLQGWSKLSGTAGHMSSVKALVVTPDLHGKTESTWVKWKEQGWDVGKPGAEAWLCCLLGKRPGIMHVTTERICVPICQREDKNYLTVIWENNERTV